MKQERKGIHRFGGAISIAALMFSAYVGPGFASGTQTTSYFLTKGWIGVFVGPVVVGLLTFLWCFINFEFNRIYKPKNFREQNDMIYKNKVIRFIAGAFLDITSFLQVILVTASMISGASILFQDMWGWPIWVGTVVFAVAILILSLRGTKLVLSVSSILTIAILVVTFYIAVIGIPAAWPAASQWLAERVPSTEFGFSKVYAWYIIVTFINMEIASRNASVTASAESLKTTAESFVASFGSGLLCTVATLVYTVIFAAGMPEIVSESIPTLYALNEIAHAGGIATILYEVIAIAAMLSTGVALLYGAVGRYEVLVKRFVNVSKDLTLKLGISLFFIIASTLMSKFGILAIIGIGYTYMGVIATPITVFLLFVTIPYRIWKDKKNGCYPESEGI